jgi:hypothetical protein
MATKFEECIAEYMGDVCGGEGHQNIWEMYATANN